MRPWLVIVLVVFSHAVTAQTITLRGTTTASGNDTSAQILEPGVAAVGDLLLVQIAVRGLANCAAITAPAGWTQVTCNAIGGTLVQGVYRKTATIADQWGNFAWTFASHRYAATMLVYGGVDTLDGVADQTNAASTTATAPSITTTQANDKVVALFSVPRAGVTLTANGSLTSRANADSGSGGAGVAAKAADMTQAAAGATGVQTATISSSQQSIGALIGLKAADCTSNVASGNWNTAGTWTKCRGGVPLAGDLVTINNGHSVTLNTSPPSLLLLTNNGTLTDGGNSSRTLTMGGNIVNAGTLSLSNTTVVIGANTTWSGNGTWSLGTIDFNWQSRALTLASGATFTLDLYDSTPIDNLGSGNGSFNAGGANTTATVNFARSGSQTMNTSGIVYPHVTLSGSGTKSNSGTFDVRGNLTVGSGTTLSQNGDIDLYGNLTNSGTFNYSWGTFTFRGTSGQSISGATAFLALRINNASGVTLNSDVTLSTDGTLTLSSGNIVTGNNDFVFAGDCPGRYTLNRTSGYVLGNVRLTFPAWGVSCLYPVGDSTGYAPMTISKTGSNAGTLVGRVDGGDHPDGSGTVGIDQSKNANHYWTLTAGSLSSATPYSATFQFCATGTCSVPAEVDTGAATGSFAVAKKSGTWSSQTVGTRASTTTQATGLAGFGVFEVGEAYTLPAPTVAKTFSPASIATNGTSVLSITITNPNSTAITGLAFADTYPSNLVNASSPALANSCGGTATGAAGAGSLSLSGGTLAGNSSCTVSVNVTSATAGSYVNSTGAVSSANAQNGSAASATLTVSAAPAACNSGTVTGVVNTYYPVSASLSAGATSITVGTSTGASTALAQNDLVLIMQMQDASIDTSNTSTYGSASAINAGKYEYAVVASVVGSTVTLTSALTNSYTRQAGSNAVAQKSIQLIRVPVYSSATLGSGTTALAWNGSTGGILAFDVTGALGLNSASVDVSGKGFRGGGGRLLSGGSGANTDYRTLATNNANASKGEGIAGTPRYLNNSGSLQDNGVEGYPNGSYARGAPANAGGGGTDDDPANNDENTGGGGGANAGGGGYGGYAWSASASPGQGIGGAAVTPSASQLFLGGGGGAATSNNGTGSPGSGFASSGAAGGGLVMLRAGSLTGTATINVNGANANNTVLNDGSGGGGAGGTVLVHAGSGLSGLSVTAVGGTGGTNTGGGSDHGPGGGGGGGYVISTSALASCSVVGGANGTTYSSHTYGATPGAVGACPTNGSLAGSIPGKSLGSGPCSASLGSFSVSVPATASTCGRYPALAYPAPPPATFPLPPVVTVTAKDAGGSTVTGYTGTVNLTTSTSRGLWAKTASANGTLEPSPDTTNDGAASYTFAAADNGVAQLYLTDEVSDTLTVTAKDSTDSSKTGTSGSISYSTNAFVITEDSIQVASKPQAMSVTLWSQDSGKNCAAATGYAGSQSVKAWLTRSVADPGGAAPTIGVLSLPNAIPDSDNLTLSFTGGVASFSLNTTDVGAYSLSLQDTTTFSGSSVTVSGSSNILLVRPFAVGVDCVKQGGTASTAAECLADGTQNSGADTVGGNIFAKAGSAFQARISGYLWNSAADSNSDGLPDAGATHAQIVAAGVAPKFAHTVTLAAGAPFAPTTPSDTPVGTGTAGTLANGSVAVAAGSSTVISLAYSEVGAFTLTATPAANYLGSLSLSNRTVLFTPGTTRCSAGVCTVGRFTPDHFALTPAAASNGCGTFTYFGQDFTTPFTLTAQRSCSTCTVADTTTNYDGTLGWSRFTTTTWSNYTFSADNGVTLTAGTAAPTGAWVAGVASITAAHNPTRPAAQVAPVDVTVSANPADSDGIGLAAATAVSTAAVPLRFGMLKIDNASGSERQNLPVRVAAMYYDGNPIGWRGNTADSCTATLALAAFGSNTATAACYGTCTGVAVGSVGSVLLRRPAGNTASGLAIAAAPTPGTAVTLTSGSGSAFVTLRSPNTGTPAAPTPGALDFILVAPAWLKANSGDGGTANKYDWNPMGRITFGVFGPDTNKRKFIYIRENY